MACFFDVRGTAHATHVHDLILLVFFLPDVCVFFIFLLLCFFYAFTPASYFFFSTPQEAAYSESMWQPEKMAEGAEKVKKICHVRINDDENCKT